MHDSGCAHIFNRILVLRGFAIQVLHLFGKLAQLQSHIPKEICPTGRDRCFLILTFPSPFFLVRRTWGQSTKKISEFVLEKLQQQLSLLELFTHTVATLGITPQKP